MMLNRFDPTLASLLMAFLLEVALLCAVAIWALDAFPAVAVPAVAVPAAVFAAAVIVVFWARYMSPRAKRCLPWPVRPKVACGFYLLGALALAVTGHGVWAVLFATIAVVHTALEFRLARRPALRRSMR